MDKNFVTKFLKGSAFASAGTFTTVVFHFMSITFLTRWATKDTLGLYFLILAIANGGKILANVGLDLTLVRSLALESKERQRPAFAAVMWTRALVLLVIFVLAYIFSNPLLALANADNSQILRWYIPLLVTLMSVRELLFYVLQGVEKYHLYAGLQTASALFKLILIIVSIHSLDLQRLIYIEFAMLSVSIPFQLVAIRSSNLGLPLMLPHRAKIAELLRFGLPLYANSILAFLSDYASVFILGIFVNTTAIAAFEVARKIPDGFMRLFLSFQVVYYPTLSTLFGDNNLKSAQKLMNKSLVLLASGVFFIVLTGFLFSREIVLVVFSETYLDVQPAFVLILLAVCLELLASTMGYSLVSAGYPGLSSKANVIAIGLDLVISFLLIPLIGYNGAAIAYVCMTVIAQVMNYKYLRRIHVNVDIQTYSKPFLCLFIVAAIYVVGISESFLWRLTLLNLYIVLSLVLIPDCHQAIVYIWDLARRRKLQEPK